MFAMRPLFIQKLKRLGPDKFGQVSFGCIGLRAHLWASDGAFKRSDSAEGWHPWAPSSTNRSLNRLKVDIKGHRYDMKCIEVELGGKDLVLTRELGVGVTMVLVWKRSILVKKVAFTLLRVNNKNNF